MSKNPEAAKPSSTARDATALKGGQAPGSSSHPIEIFELEKRFPDTAAIFTRHKVNAASDEKTVIALDTNALLLPYTVSNSKLPELKEVFSKLAASKRLFIPARVAREFAKNREKKLAEIIKTLNDNKSKIATGDKALPPIVELVGEGSELVEAINQLGEAKKKYFRAVEQVIEKVRAWSGDDPVTEIYNSVFSPDSIIENKLSNEVLANEWGERLSRKVPPGYADGGKPDTGVGDFLIWSTLMQIAQDKKSDVIFVTGDSKGDWFVRTDSNPEFPRPELIHEFHSRTGGRRIRLAKLHELLGEMSAPQELVDEVESAEAAQRARGKDEIASLNSWPSSSTDVYSFKYKAPYGGNKAYLLSPFGSFEVEFSEQSKGSVWLYARGVGCKFVANCGEIAPESEINSFRPELEYVSVALNETFLIRNQQDQTLIGKIVDIADTGNDGPLHIDFIYRINSVSNSRLRSV